MDVDLVEDGERLPGVPPSSQDFIVANHFLEHCEDPIGTLQTPDIPHPPGRRALMAVPDADLTFDAGRPSTIVGAPGRGPRPGRERSRRAHYEEWARLVEGVEEEEAGPRAAQLLDMGYSIHFHVWRLDDLLGFFMRCIDEVGVPLTLEAVARFGIEAICVLRARSDASGQA